MPSIPPPYQARRRIAHTHADDARDHTNVSRRCFPAAFLALQGTEAEPERYSAANQQEDVADDHRTAEVSSVDIGREKVRYWLAERTQLTGAEEVEEQEDGEDERESQSREAGIDIGGREQHGDHHEMKYLSPRIHFDGGREIGDDCEPGDDDEQPVPTNQQPRIRGSEILAQQRDPRSLEERDRHSANALWKRDPALEVQSQDLHPEPVDVTEHVCQRPADGLGAVKSIAADVLADADQDDQKHADIGVASVEIFADCGLGFSEVVEALEAGGCGALFAA